MSSRSLPSLTTGARFERRALPSTAQPLASTADEVEVWTGIELPRVRENPLDTAPPVTSRKVLMLDDMMAPERNSFGVMRLLMALAVLISHSVFLATGRNDLEPLYAWTGYTLGQHGVQVFFFLSGILVAQSLMKSESLQDYAVARALRIFPALAVCVLLTALVLGPWLSALPAADFLKNNGVALYIVKTISLVSGSATLPGLFEHSPGAAKGVVNSSLWTLKYEVICYVILAAIGWLAIRTKAYREVAIAAIAAWLALVVLAPSSLILGVPKTTLEVIRYFLVFFGAGVVAYVLRRWIPMTVVLLVPLGFLFAAAIGTHYLEPAAALFLGYGALWLATFKFGGLRAFTNENDYSYGTYIYSLPVSQALIHLYGTINLFSLIALTMGIVAILSFLSWEFVERPALSLRKRLAPRAVDAETTQPVAMQSDHLPAQLTRTQMPSVATAIETTKAVAVAQAKAEAAAAVVAAALATRQPVKTLAATNVARPWRVKAAMPRLEAETASTPEPQPASVQQSRIAFAIQKRAAAPIRERHAEPKKPAAETAIDLDASGWTSKPRPRWQPIESPVASS